MSEAASPGARVTAGQSGRDSHLRSRGYQPAPYLAAMAGEIVDYVAITDRFLADVRRTIADCVADAHYGRWADLAHAAGMRVSGEAGGECRGAAAGAFGDNREFSGHIDLTEQIREVVGPKESVVLFALEESGPTRFRRENGPDTQKTF